MAQIVIGGLDAVTIEKLEARAQRHGRTLELEVQEILRAAAQIGAVEVRSAAAAIRRSLAGSTQTDSAELLGDERTR